MISHRQASEIDVHRGLWETPEPHALPVSGAAANRTSPENWGEPLPVGQHHADLQPP